MGGYYDTDGNWIDDSWMDTGYVPYPSPDPSPPLQTGGDDKPWSANDTVADWLDILNGGIDAWKKATTKPGQKNPAGPGGGGGSMNGINFKSPVVMIGVAVVALLAVRIVLR